MDLNQITEAFISLRDKRDEIGREADKKRAELKVHMDRLEQEADKLMGSAQSIKTDAGTAYRTKTMRAKVTDRDAWFAWVAERECWEMLTTHVATAEVKEYADSAKDSGGVAPAGLELSEVCSINFRRS
jgi:hypothetical protein